MNSYTLSSGTTSPYVDDEIRVYLNGNLLLNTGPTASGWGPVTFSAKLGDVLKVEAYDNYGVAKQLTPLILSCQTKSKMLSAGVPDTPIGPDPIGKFFDQSFIINLQPEIKTDEEERRKKREKQDDPDKLEYECDCGGCRVKETGSGNSSLDLDAGVLSVAYNSQNAGDSPASLGYGWSMGLIHARLEFPSSGDLVFWDGSGSFERWTLDGSDYVLAHPDNYIQAQENLDGSFTLTYRSQSQLNFNSSGELLEIVDRNGNTTTFTRDSNGHITTVDDGEGRTLHFSYGTRTDGQPVSIRREDGSTGLETQFVYDSSDRLWKIIQPEGETDEFLYDSNGRLWKHIDPRSEVAVEFTYVASGTHAGKVETATYYGERQLTYTYGTDTVTIDEDDLSSLSDSVTRTTILTFRERGQLVRKEDPLGNVWEWEYDDIYNPYLMTLAIDPNLNTTEYVYDQDGLLVSMTDAQGNTTTYTYNQPSDTGYTAAKRYQIKEIQRPSVTVGGSPVTYDPTRFSYDSLGNLIEVEDALGNSVVLDVGTDGRITSVTDRRGQETTFTYTTAGSGLNAGNLATVTAPAGPNSAPARQVTFTYDAYDRVTEVEDHGGNTVQYQYDDDSRLTRLTDPRGKYWERTFVDGLLDSIDLPKNQGSGTNRRGVRFTYDDSGRMLQSIAKTGASTEEMRVRVEYDGRSNLRTLARLKDSLEVAHQYTYDKLNRTLEVLDPLLRSTEIEHAPFCSQRTVTSPRGVITVYSFDSLCRLTQVASGREVFAYEYDELGRPVTLRHREKATYGKARFHRASYSTAPLAERVTTMEYDALDRLVEITFPGAETIAYEYDEEGAVTKITDVHGKVTRFTYYNDGRLYEVIVERPLESDRVFTYTYDAAGRLSQIDYPSSTGIVAKFSGPSNEAGWDEAGNLLHLRYLKSNVHLQRFAYTYDDSGNRISMEDVPENTANTVLWEYGYDWLNRLTSVSRDSTLTTVYTYDESDNRLSLELPQLSQTYNYTYDDASQIEEKKLGSTTVETFQHDADGNMIARAAGLVTTTYKWGDRNQLLEIREGGTLLESYRYDFGNIRDRKGDGSQYFSSGAASLSDMRPSNVPVSYFQGHRLLGMEVDGDFYFYLSDALGTVRLVVDEDGDVVASASYDEFGVQESATGSASLRPHGYTGALGVRNDWDASGLYYARARYYDSGLGRWLSPDPIGFAGRPQRLRGNGQQPDDPG